MWRPAVDSYDVAIVLGARLADDGTASPALVRRVVHGVELLHAGVVGALVMSGGPTSPAGIEAETMRAMAVAAGVETARVMVEGRALNTIQNALFCRPLLRRHGWRRVLVVTDAFHVPRTRYIFARLGLAVTVTGVRPSRPSAQWWLAHLREAAAVPWTVLRVEAFRSGMFRLARRGRWFRRQS